MKQVATLVASLFAIALCGIAYFLFAPDVIRYRNEIRRGDRLVSEIEAFRRAKGQLPESFADFRIDNDEAQRFFYQRCSATHYIVWFGTMLGESMTYDSAKHRWDSINGVYE